MRITVFGAFGDVGRRVVEEARRRGHHVTPVSRRPRPGGEVGDAGAVADVVRFGEGRDLVVGATRPAPGREDELVEVTRALLAGTARTGARLLVVGGAGTLATPDGGTVLDAPDFPAGLRPVALAGAAQLAACRAETTADWTYLSPPALLEPGPRTGSYRVGGDELVVDAAGRSAISLADLAVALLDEAEKPAHHRARFTVGY